MLNEYSNVFDTLPGKAVFLLILFLTKWVYRGKTNLKFKVVDMVE